MYNQGTENKYNNTRSSQGRLDREETGKLSNAKAKEPAPKIRPVSTKLFA